MEILGIIIGVVGVIVAVIQTIVVIKDRKERKSKSNLKSSKTDNSSKLSVYDNIFEAQKNNGDQNGFTEQSELTNIVASSNLFFGRSNDLKKIEELFQSRNRRLVTILGTAGLGKTRLAKEFGRRYNDLFSGGIWFVDLVEATTQTGIAYAIHQVFESELASSQIEPQDAVIELLNDKGPLLLIMDNFEQIVDLAEGSIGYWLKSLPQVYFLVTSRKSLRLVSEQNYRLRPLDIPTVDREVNVDNYTDYSSIKLFIERARSFVVNFKLTDQNIKFISQICRDLEGIPLAIELTAAKIKVMSPRQISARLSDKLKFRDDIVDRDKKHQTLSLAIDWSYQLLQLWEKNAFLQMAIFQDGFDLDAAEKVIDTSSHLESPPILDILNSLLDQSLLKSYEENGEMRYDMYVAIKEFATDAWEKSTNSKHKKNLYERWASYYIPYCENLNLKIRSTEGKEALSRLVSEMENIFTIQECFLELNDPVTAAKAILSFAQTMEVRGPAPLRVPKLMASFNAFENQNNIWCARLAFTLSKAFWARGEWNDGLKYSHIGVELSRNHGTKMELAEAIAQFGHMIHNRGHLRNAIDITEEASQIFLTENQMISVAKCYTKMGSLYERIGNLNKALRNYEEAEKISKAYDDNIEYAMVFNRRGLAYWHHGILKKALEELHNAEEVSKNFGNKAWIAAHQTNQGLVYADLDDFDESIKYFKIADRSHKDLGYLHWAAVNYGGWGRALMMRNEGNDLTKAIKLMRIAEDLAKKVYYPENIAMHVGDLGRAFLMQGKLEDAYQNIKEAIALERLMGANISIRHFSNLVTFSRCCYELGKMNELWESIILALRIKAELGLSENTEVRKTNEDVHHLNSLVLKWGEKQNSLIDEMDSESLEFLHQIRPPKTLFKRENLGSNADLLIKENYKVYARFDYEYPWYDLEEDFQKRNEQKLKLFGYGSLMNKVSANQTISDETSSKFTKALAFGIIRLLDYEMPDEVRKRPLYAGAENSINRALFNARYTGSITDYTNGLIYEVDISEVQSLRDREIGYDLIPIFCISLNSDPNNPEIIHAYALGCSDRAWEGRKLTNSKLLPHVNYYKLCREGAEAISDEFLSYFLDTSYLADRKTTAREWENTLKLKE